MRVRIFQLLIAAMLFTSMEGAVESEKDEVFHQTHHAHAEGADQWYPDSDGDEHDSDNCEHFCHVHVLGLISHLSAAQRVDSSRLVVPRSTMNRNRKTAPPTPPPNA